MSCTQYAGDTYADDEDLSNLINAIKEQSPDTPIDEIKAIAKKSIVEHNQSANLNAKLYGSLLYDDNGVTEYDKIDNISITPEGAIVSLVNGKTFDFKPDKDGILTDGKVSSDTLTEAWHSIPKDGESLFNTSSSSDMDKLFSGTKISTDTVANTMAKLAELDQKATNSNWDAKHSEYLNKVVHNLIVAGAIASDIKVRVTENTVDALEEPFGEYDPNKATNDQIRVATADISKQAQNRFIMSNQEALVHEVNHAGLDYLFNNTERAVEVQDIKSDIRNLYRQAKDKLTYKDLLPDNPTQDEIDKAKELYRYVFDGKLDDTTVKDANVRLHEFMNYASTNKFLKKAVDELPLAVKSIKEDKSDSFIEKIFKRILNFIQKTVSTFNHKRNRADTVGTELTRLVARLSHAQYKYANRAKESSFRVTDTEVGETLEKATNKLDKKVKKFIESGFEKVGISKDSKYTTKDIEDKIKVLSKLGDEFEKSGYIKKTIILSQMLPSIAILYRESEKHNIRPDIHATYSRFLYQLDNAGISFIKDLIADFSGGRKTLVEVTDMAMKFNTRLDRYRDANYIGTLNDIYTAFNNVNFNKRKNVHYLHALSDVVLRGDLQSVTTDSQELHKVLTNDTYLATKIAKLETKIKGLEYVNDFAIPENVGKDMIVKASKLAKTMIKGSGFRTNAENIARNFGTMNTVGYEINHISDYDLAEVTNDIDQLASLYSLQHMNTEAKNNLIDLISKDPKGVSSYLSIAKGAQVATKEDWLTSGTVQDMIKGQLHESTNNNKDIQYAPIADMKKMKDLGYRFIRKVQTDSNDLDKSLYGMFVSDEVGLTKRVDGTLGLQRIKVKGLLLSEKIRYANSGLSPKALVQLVQEGIRKAATLPSNDIMTPVYNSQGMIIDYRYDQNIADKEKYLDMEKRGTELLAKSFGQRYTQTITDETNREVIDLIFNDYDKLNMTGDTFLDNSHLYVKVAAVKRDKLTAAEQALGKIYSEDNVYVARNEGEELWGLLPPDARNYIIEKNREFDIKNGKTGKDLEDRKEIYIRKDLLKQVFGYDEASLANSALLKQLPNKYRRKIQMTGNLVANAMEIAKGNVVYKLPRTVINNIVSNSKFLYYSGIPFKKSFEYLLLSKRSLDKWKVNESTSRSLERQIDSATGSKRDNLRKKLAEVRAEMNDNPLKPLMDEGMYQTIVDDVSIGESNNKIVAFAEDMLAKATGDNSIASDLVHTAVMSRKSTLGKIALNITAESDLHFRAATYWFGKDLIENNKKLSMKEKSIAMKGLMREVKDNYINYSKIINSKTIKWLDRMGPEAFWKYFANIQRVNLRLVKTHIYKVIANILAEEVIGLPAGTLDSSLITSWDGRLNPLEWPSNVADLIEGGTTLPISNLLTL